MTEQPDEAEKGSRWSDVAAGAGDGIEVAEAGCGALGCLASATSGIVLFVPACLFWS